jgi:hypothetical protein
MIATGSVVGVDLPISTLDAGFVTTASASISAEMSALFRDGTPKNIEENEVEGDPYSDHVYDMRPWFGFN